MSTPIGHSLFGATLARRLGIRSPLGIASAVVAASLPDTDVLLGLVVHGDPWKLHRKGTHTLGFAMSSGMLAGLAGLVSAGNAEGERDLIADALTGAVIVGSHVLLDNLPFPYLDAQKRDGESARAPGEKKKSGINLLNWAIDGAFYGFLAWKLWPREPAEVAS